MAATVPNLRYSIIYWSVSTMSVLLSLWVMFCAFMLLSCFVDLTVIIVAFSMCKEANALYPVAHLESWVDRILFSLLEKPRFQVFQFLMFVRLFISLSMRNCFVVTVLLAVDLHPIRFVQHTVFFYIDWGVVLIYARVTLQLSDVVSSQVLELVPSNPVAASTSIAAGKKILFGKCDGHQTPYNRVRRCIVSMKTFAKRGLLRVMDEVFGDGAGYGGTKWIMSYILGV